MDNEISFKNTPFDSPITEFALALATVNKDDEWYPSGTAIIIGAYLAMTAKHVVEDYFKKYGDCLNEELASFSLVAVQFITRENKTKMAKYVVNKICAAQNSDIAFLFLTPFNNYAAEYKWNKTMIDILPPEVGEEIHGFGYSKSSAKLTEEDFVRWTNDPRTTSGVVKEVHINKRDNCRLNFPCFRTNARFDGGMSGGPVFNSKGFLIGIICSNLPPTNDSEEHASYVTLLWQSMITLVNFNRKGYQPGSSYIIYDLAVDGIISVLNLDKLVVKRGDNNRYDAYLYHKININN